MGAREPMAEQQSYGGIPGSPSKTINLPLNAGFAVFETFETLNTKPPRPAIQESEMAWCDGFMPFGPSNIRTLYGVGATKYSASTGRTITAFWFYNQGDTPYAAVLLSNGQLDQVNTTNSVTTNILPAGSIQNPNPHATSVTQWNGKYLIIVSSQPNGFWIWDFTNTYTAGQMSPEVAITNSGQNYTSAPTITFQTTSGSAVAPTFSATVQNGFVTGVTVLTPGSGFVVSDFVGISFSGGGSDTTAQVSATVNPNVGQVTNIVITNSTTNIPAAAYVTLDGGGGTGATAALIVNDGALESITVTNGGKNYTTPPTVTFHSLGSPPTLPTAVAELSYGSVTGGTINNAGTGYRSPPLVTIVGDGTGAQAQAIVNNSGNVTSIVMANPGYGYSKALFIFSGGNNAADALVNLMPFGVQGSTAEIYTNRVWVGDGNKGYFTAPATATDFSPADGAGAFQSNDSFQRVAYHSFKQTNGFLYLISDSSINYIGGVQASGTPVQTVFNNINVDPQIGTPWPSTVQLFSRNIVFGNSFGIFVSYGGAVTKISTPLDGIYNTVVTPSSGNPNLFPSSAIASIFGIAVYMMLLPIIDQYTGLQVNKLLMWDGKRWWTSPQDVALTYVYSQEINSVLTAWGTDGTNLFPLFQTPTSNFQKVVQSKLWAQPSYYFKKTNPEIAGILNFYNTTGTISVTVDSELGTADGVTIEVVSTAEATWTNNANVVVQWTNSTPIVVVWGAPGLAIIPPQIVGQVGILMGMTVFTNAMDVSILSLSLLQQNYQWLG